jgi:hypothetical protein
MKTTKRIPKTVQEIAIQGYYSYGWEDIFYASNEKEARQILKDYNENEPNYAHRIVRRRIPNPEYKA